MKDLTPHEKRLLNEIDPRSYLVKLGDKFATIVKSINDLEEAIKIMPHQFINHKENKTYKFGFQVSVDGKPQIIYEEVV